MALLVAACSRTHALTGPRSNVQASDDKLAEATKASGSAAENISRLELEKKQDEVRSWWMRAPWLCATTELASCVVQEARAELAEEARQKSETDAKKRAEEAERLEKVTTELRVCPS